MTWGNKNRKTPRRRRGMFTSTPVSLFRFEVTKKFRMHERTERTNGKFEAKIKVRSSQLSQGSSHFGMREDVIKTKGIRISISFN